MHQPRAPKPIFEEKARAEIESIIKEARLIRILFCIAFVLPVVAIAVVGGSIRNIFIWRRLRSRHPALRVSELDDRAPSELVGSFQGAISTFWVGALFWPILALALAVFFAMFWSILLMVLCLAAIVIVSHLKAIHEH